MGLRYYISHRSGSKTKTSSSHSLPWALKGKFSIYPREQQGRLGGKESSPNAHTRWKPILRKINNKPLGFTRQLTTNPRYSIWAGKLKTGSPQGIKQFLSGGFHFLITLLFSVILIYAIFRLVLCRLPYCCKLVTKTFRSKKETWDQQVQTVHSKN